MANLDRNSASPDQPGVDVWMPEEYEAGHWSRLQNMDEFRTATYCWRAGWQDADRELAASSRGTNIVSMDDAAQAQRSAYGTGRSARVCGLPFDVNRSDTWKQSWVETDIALGLAGTRKIL